MTYHTVLLALVNLFEGDLASYIVEVINYKQLKTFLHFLAPPGKLAIANYVAKNCNYSINYISDRLVSIEGVSGIIC